MEDWQQRVIVERFELDSKIDRLATFYAQNATFSTISPAEMDRLYRQLRHMHAYAAVLAERIATFNQPKEP